MPLKDLGELLRQAKPVRQSGNYVFTTGNGILNVPLPDVVMIFQETEGLTLILERSVADRHELSYEFVAAWITMTVPSALDAVGFTAAFAKALTEAGIPCNVVAAYHHDHLFVPVERADEAVEILNFLGGN